jgi:hypothetical protein
MKPVYWEKVWPISKDVWKRSERLDTRVSIPGKTNRKTAIPSSRQGAIWIGSGGEFEKFAWCEVL